MIKRLSPDFTDRIFEDYPTLENLNLSNNGNFSLINLLYDEIEIAIIENLDKFSTTLKILSISSNKVVSLVPQNIAEFSTGL